VIYEILSAAVDTLHALAMVAWVLGLPLLFWHRWPRLSGVYVVYSLAFVVITRVSHAILGECVLTTLSRDLWNASGLADRGHSSFTVRLVDAIAGIHFTEHSAVLLWEGAVFVCSAGMLWYLVDARRRRRRHDDTARA
jgi:hypothetical protein